LVVLDGCGLVRRAHRYFFHPSMCLRSDATPSAHAPQAICSPLIETVFETGSARRAFKVKPRCQEQDRAPAHLHVPWLETLLTTIVSGSFF
jgi:hypothetical protein